MERKQIAYVLIVLIIAASAYGLYCWRHIRRARRHRRR